MPDTHATATGSDLSELVIGVLGGTGDQGRGLARRLAMAGQKVIIGSRDAGKVVVDCVNPLGFDKRGAYPIPVPEGSAAQQAATVLPDSTVVGAFHHVSAVLLLDPDVAELDLDILVLGDDRAATDLVQALAELLPGARGVYAGRLRNCGQVEALTANLVSVNRRYKAHAGVRITDI
jgi:NADPH-dependent F420 reductase